MKSSMPVFATKVAKQLFVMGFMTMAVGLFVESAAVIAWGSSIVVTLMIARKSSLYSVSRVREAGLEMAWVQVDRVVRVRRNESVEFEAEIRNRSSVDVSIGNLRMVASRHLRIHISPTNETISPHGSIRVNVKVQATRVGYHGLFGLAFEVVSSHGLFEVPLSFSNPIGFEVWPSSLWMSLFSSRGGRERRDVDGNVASRLRGEGGHFRELRAHQPGDSFRRIAWKASARRGKLMVIERDADDPTIVWILLDVSNNHFAGPSGASPIDIAVDKAAALIGQHIRRGDRVGLMLFDGMRYSCVMPEHGPSHGVVLARNLMLVPVWREKSALDESEMATLVFEHLRSLDPNAGRSIRKADLDTLVRRSEAVRVRFAPFKDLPMPEMGRESMLRNYVASFGIDTPLRESAPISFQKLMEEAMRCKVDNASIVYVVNNEMDFTNENAVQLVRQLRRRGAQVVIVFPSVKESLNPESYSSTEVSIPLLHAQELSDALYTEYAMYQRRNRRRLQQVGVSVI